MLIVRNIAIALVSIAAAALVALRFQRVRQMLFRYAPRTQQALDRVYPAPKNARRSEAPPTYGQA